MNSAVRIWCAVMAGILVPGVALAKTTDIGKAEVVVPDAKRTSVEQDERVLQVGADVFKDDVVNTGNIGAVMLLFTDKTTLKIFPNSKIKLDNYVYDSDKTVLRVGLSLLSGAMRIASGGPHAADKYQLRTPQATIGIRGTVIHIVSDDERTVVEALHGSFNACATTGSACRTVSASDDMNALRVWTDGRIELARARRDLGVRSAEGSSDVPATQPALQSPAVTSIGGADGRDQGGNEANRLFLADLFQAPRLNPPVVSPSAVGAPATSAPGPNQGAHAPSASASGPNQGIGAPTASAPGPNQEDHALTGASDRSSLGSLFDFTAAGGASQSYSGGSSSGSAPTPGVSTVLGLTLVGGTAAFLRRKRETSPQSDRPAMTRSITGQSTGAKIAVARPRPAPPPVHTATWAMLVFSCGTVLSAILQRHLLEAPQTAQHLVEFDVGEAFGLVATLSLVLAALHRRVSLTGSDIAVLVLSALAWFVPEQHGVYLATTLAGIWFLLTRRSDRQLAAIGQIWLALSMYELWGKLIFKFVYQTIEVFEVGLIYGVGRLFYPGLGVDGATLSIRGDWSIVVLEGCSSLHNLSLVVLIWLSILKMADRRVSPAAFRALGLSACLVVAINVARILAMLPSQGVYLFWHDGSGASVVALGSVLAAIVPIVLCIEAPTGERASWA